MGQRLLAAFAEADRIGGLVAKMRLAQMTGMTSTQAATADDAVAIVARFETALATLRAEHAPGAPVVRAMVPGREDVATLRKHIGTYLDLMSQHAVFLGSVTETVRRIDEAAAETLAVARVSVWFSDDARTKISCADLFERATAKHSSGVELFAKDFAPYFAALKQERTIAAHDAHKDPRTACFSASYLGPLGITSMLDVPIWSGSKMVGVVCHEHVGPARTWTSDEEKFGYLMASFVALALERAPAAARLA